MPHDQTASQKNSCDSQSLSSLANGTQNREASDKMDLSGCSAPGNGHWLFPSSLCKRHMENLRESNHSASSQHSPRTRLTAAPTAWSSCQPPWKDSPPPASDLLLSEALFKEPATPRRLSALSYFLLLQICSYWPVRYRWKWPEMCFWHHPLKILA